MSIEKAIKEIINEEDTLRKKEDDKAKTQAVIKENGVTKPFIYHETAVEFLKRFEDSSVDLLITDPPYMTDVENINEFIDSWLDVAIKKVKSTGRAYIFCGAYPVELCSYLSRLNAQNHLIFENVLVWTYKNAIGPTQKNTFVHNWQAILYLKGKDAPV